jgi:pyruvate dehydrogenase E1 component
VERTDTEWRSNAIAGGYWLHPPAPGAEAAILFSGAIAPEALSAWETLREDIPGIGLLNVTSPTLLHRGWSAQHRARWISKERVSSHIEALLAPLSPNAKLVTILDGAPAALSWIGGVCGHCVSPLGTEQFGQTGDLIDLYRHHRLDSEAIIDAAAELLLGRS